MRSRLQARLIVTFVVSVAAILLPGAALHGLQRVRCEVVRFPPLADGRFHVVARLSRRYGAAPAAGDLLLSGADASRIRVEAGTNRSLLVLYRAPVSGGSAHLSLREGKHAWVLPLHADATWNDHVGDGLPDALRLHTPEDRLAFRRWFVALAERSAAVPDHDLPAEITDCSALLRYGYRLALMKHDDRWYAQFPPGTMPQLSSVTQWNYPESPLGAALFRITPPGGTPKASDFAEFADAKTLWRWNSFRVGRDVRLARPGDLLFFHQLEGEQQYHSMIVTGDGEPWVVYHTGPSGRGSSRVRGEMRRARTADLLNHPDPRWHPTAANPNFLGVFRWNLLREE